MGSTLEGRCWEEESTFQTRENSVSKVGTFWLLEISKEGSYLEAEIMDTYRSP